MTTAQTVTDTEIQRLVDAYRTAELATMAKDGTPIAWPIVAVRDPDSGLLTLTTSIGFPAKAHHIRRDPRVSLYFSEPRGSGLDHPARLLVQGTASCSDEIVTDPSAYETFWRTLYARQPAGMMYGATALTRWFFDWYYFRLVVTVTPERVTATSDPVVAAPAAQRPRVIRGYPTAVLTTVDPDGLPRSTRVTPVQGPDGSIVIDGVEGVTDGPASLLCHRHDERTWRLSSVVLTGVVRSEGAGLRFDLRRVLPGASQNPVALLAMMRGARATAAGYLARRGLDRPAVPWAAYKQLY